MWRMVLRAIRAILRPEPVNPSGAAEALMLERRQAEIDQRLRRLRREVSVWLNQ